ALVFHRSSRTNTIMQEEIPADALEIGKATIARVHFFDNCFRKLLAYLESQRHDQHFLAQVLGRPDVISGEDAIFLYRQPVKHAFNVFRIYVFPASSHNHVLLAAEKLQMPGGVETPEVAGE